MKRIFMFFCFLGSLFMGVNNLNNVKAQTTDINTSLNPVQFAFSEDEINLSNDGKEVTVDIYEISNTGERVGGSLARVTFGATNDTKNLYWTITPLTLKTITFSGTLSQTNLTHGISAGSTSVSGLTGMKSTAGNVTNQMIAHLDGTIYSLGQVAPFPRPLTVTWTNK